MRAVVPLDACRPVEPLDEGVRETQVCRSKLLLDAQEVQTGRRCHRYPAVNLRRDSRQNEREVQPVFNRTSVSAELQPQLRLYRRLWLSSVDLEEAQAAIQEILRSKLPFPRKTPPAPLLLSLTTALVVAYARPFVNARGQSSVAERTLPGSLLRVFTSHERALHETVIQIRNREVAHSDADILDMSLILHTNAHGAIYLATRDPFRRTELRMLNRMIDKLEREIQRRCEELRTVLPLDKWL